MQKNRQKLLAILLTLLLLFTIVPMVFAEDICTHAHDTDCGYVDGAPCGHIQDENCGWDEETQIGCTHEHDWECGYIETVPCEHVHDESCGGLPIGDLGKDIGTPGVTDNLDSLDDSDSINTSASIVIIVKFDALDKEILWQGYDYGEIMSQDDIILPETLTGADANGGSVIVSDVTWESQPTFDPSVSVKYAFTPILPEEYILADGVTPPTISVFIRPDGGVAINPLAVDVNGYIVFPDPNFKAALLTQGIGNNGEISEAEAAAVTSIDARGKNISSLEGIEYFIALEELVCSDNQLTALDASKNTVLERLVCDGNQLTTLDVSNNAALTFLNCSNNQLTNLDISNNAALTQLHCNSNQLTNLDVSNNTALGWLTCLNNQP